MALLAFFKSLFGRQSEPPPEIEDGPEPSPEVQREVASAPPPKPSVDFVAIFEAAGIGAEERMRLVKAQQLLRKLLAADAPMDVKRQIIEEAFKTFDIPTSKIVATATHEIEALNAFIEHGEEEMKRIRAECVRQIAELEAKIAQAKAAMARSITEQEDRAEAASEEILKVQPVVSFFLRGEDGSSGDAQRDSVEIQVEPGTTDG